MSLTVDVVVPVFGHWQLTAQCLESLAAQSAVHHVILVDDASPDDTLIRVAAEYPSVEVIAMPTNSGFAAACNRGLAAATADIVVLFNNDVVADPLLLEKLMVPFDDPSVGSSAPLLFRPDGLIDAFGLSADVTVAGFLRLHGRAETESLRPTERLLGPYGAVAAYRRAALDEVGVLDEGIFMYGEELDLALRLSAAGWKPAATAEARGIHLGGATAGARSAKQRERAGFGRGYLLRAYRIGSSRFGFRAAVTELIVCTIDAMRSRDLASTRGRLLGWRAGARAEARNGHIVDIDRSIGFVRSMRLRAGPRK